MQRADWRPVGRSESAAMRSRHPSTSYSTDHYSYWHPGTKYRKWGCLLNGAHGALTTCQVLTMRQALPHMMFNPLHSRGMSAFLLPPFYTRIAQSSETYSRMAQPTGKTERWSLAVDRA